MLANSSGLEFWRTHVLKFRKRKGRSLSCVQVLHETWNSGEIRQFHIVVVQWLQRNLQKSVLHVQSWCFSNLHLLLLCRSPSPSPSLSPSPSSLLSILLTDATDTSCIKSARKFAAPLRIMHPPFMQTWDKLVPNYSEACPGLRNQ